MTPLISVIIPVYNVEKYIEECLDSVLSQDFSDFEVICVDDCGNDASMPIVERYAAGDERIRIIRHDRNRGLAPARNSGMSVACGKYILFLDSDDCLPEGALRHMHDAMQKGGADIVVGRFQAFPDEEDPELIKASNALNRRFSALTARDIPVTLENFQKELKTIYAVAWGMMHRTEFLKKNEIAFPDSHVYHEDICFFLQCFAALPVIRCIEAPVTRYRMRKNSITNSRNRRQAIKRKRDIRISMQQGFDRIIRHHGEEKGGHIVELIKGHPSYRRLLEKRYLGGLFVKKWIGTDRVFKLCGVSVYRELYNEDNTVEQRIFGIPFRRIG
ncbi:MAG: glycosyltransferase family 2 protein [Mailhella sp.]|nr:glycosyltransferase family 2 protein [Mailhella sp.]